MSQPLLGALERLMAELQKLLDEVDWPVLLVRERESKR